MLRTVNITVTKKINTFYFKEKGTMLKFILFRVSYFKEK